MKKILVSAAVSLLTLGLIFHLVSQGTGQEAELWPLIRDVAPMLLGGYVFCQVAQTYFRSERYRVLLRGAGEPRIPSSGHSFLATLARNAMVDLLPARAGELGYLALMNRNYQVGADTCLGSMAISFLFDMIALAAVLALAIASPWTLGQSTWPLLAAGAVALTLVCLIGLWGLFTILPKWIIPLWARLTGGIRQRRLRIGATFIANTLRSVARVRDRRLLTIAFLQSLGVRFFKYAGLFILFRAVTRIHLPTLAAAEARQVLPALLAGEGAASLPLPALMGFGAYEGGGTAVWSLLGFPAAAALLAMLALHIVSQITDYTLGGGAFIAIAWGRRAAPTATAPTRPLRRLVLRLCTLVFLAAALLFAAVEWRALRKRGRLTPPEQGAAAAAAALETQALADLAARHRGRIVWSSNRHGNHDILLMEWPGGAIRRVTRDPHTDTYPRISPDGKQVLFARSQRPWVSQRNPALWDAWITDLDTARERRVATNVFFAAWADAGRAIVFQRSQDQSVVLLTLATGAERVLLRPGTAPVPEGVSMQTPDYLAASQALAVTLRGSRRLAAWVDADGVLTPVGDGNACQLNWASPDTLIFIGHGGHMKNAIYRHSIATGQTERWLDLPGDISREYFPRLSPCGRVLVFGASAGGHEHDTADYEIFAWEPGTPPERAVRLTFHTGNDCWPDIWLEGR